MPAFIILILSFALIVFINGTFVKNIIIDMYLIVIPKVNLFVKDNYSK